MAGIATWYVVQAGDEGGEVGGAEGLGLFRAAMEGAGAAVRLETPLDPDELNATAGLVFRLSPAFFDSEACRESVRRLLAARGEVGPVCAVAGQGYAGEAASRLETWLRARASEAGLAVNVSRSTAGASTNDAPARAIDATTTMSDVSASDEATPGPCRVPARNPRFVGRREVLARVGELLAAAGRDDVACVTIQGLGGVGKSAVAFEYAHEWAAAYPGGRFLLSASGAADLRLLLIALAPELGLELTDDEQRDPAMAYARVRAALEIGERRLLVIDNVDRPELLSTAARAQYLPAGERVHVVATTRLAPAALGELPCVSPEGLTEAESVALLEAWRPLPDEDERAAAFGIARRLGGYALAMEVVAAYLADKPEITVAGYLQRLADDKVEALRGPAADDRVRLSRHNEKLLSRLLAPTLASLTPVELRAVEHAAWLAPDGVAWPWLEALTRKAFSAQLASPRPGYPDPWREVVRRLTGLRLLTEGDRPEVARMHTLVQTVVLNRMAADEAEARRTATFEYACAQIMALNRNWERDEAAWTTRCMARLAVVRLDESDVEWGPRLANFAAGRLWRVADFQTAEVLCRRAMALQERDLDQHLPDYAQTLNVLAIVKQQFDQLTAGPAGPGARELLHRAIDIAKNLPQPDYITLATCYSDLAIVEDHLGRWTADADGPGARELLLHAIDVGERGYGRDDPQLADFINNLATIEKKRGHLITDADGPGARELFRRAIDIEEKALGSDHPNLAIRYGNLGVVERALGRLTSDADGPGARELFLRAIAIDEKAFAPDHPVLAIRYSNLALLERTLGHLTTDATGLGARELLLRAIAIDEKIYGTDHSNLATMYHNLASVEQSCGRLAAGPAGPGARELFLHAIAIDQRTSTDSERTRASRYVNLAGAEEVHGHLTADPDGPDARELLPRAIALVEENFGADPVHVVAAGRRLPALEGDDSRFPDARSLYLWARDAYSATYGPDSANVARTEIALGRIALASGEPEAADDYLDHAETLLYADPQTRAAPELLLRLELAQARLQQGRRDEALRLAGNLHARLSELIGEDSAFARHVATWLTEQETVAQR